MPMVRVRVVHRANIFHLQYVAALGTALQRSVAGHLEVYQQSAFGNMNWMLILRDGSALSGSEMAQKSDREGNQRI